MLLAELFACLLVSRNLSGNNILTGFRFHVLICGQFCSTTNSGVNMVSDMKHVVFTAVKLVILLCCSVLCLLQSYYEVSLYTQHQVYSTVQYSTLYTQHQVYTATSVISADTAPVHLVFCDSYLARNKEGV